jgi:glutaconate CoA-transferase subunit A
MLIGAGCVAAIECGAVTLDEYGMAPRFRQAVENGDIRIVDSTCPAIYAALQAAEKGSPFAAMRGIIGSDILRYRNDWQVIENPFADGDDPVLLVPALSPDVALFHARLADRQGNVWVGNKRELVIMAHAARSVLVTAEDIYDGNLVGDERFAAGTIAALYVDAVSHAPDGARPVGLAGRYPPDAPALTEYARLAATPEGFADFLARHLPTEKDDG